MGGTHVVDSASLQVAADPAGLDVDDGAGTQVDGEGGRPRRGDRLVEADRGPDPLGQGGVAGQIVLRQGLLDQQQVQVVEAGQPGRVGQGVGAVGVHLEQDVAETLAHRSDRRHVPARFDLQLDPAVAGVDVSGHRIQQRRYGVGDADRHARVHRVAYGTEVSAQ